jgi:hypothetical protein
MTVRFTGPISQLRTDPGETMESGTTLAGSTVEGIAYWMVASRLLNEVVVLSLRTNRLDRLCPPHAPARANVALSSFI